MDMISAVALYIVAGLALIYSTIALLIVLLRQPAPTDRPVEGIHGLSDALTAGSDLPTQHLHRPVAGTVYAASHRRKGAGRWLAHLGRTHRGRPATKIHRLP